MQHMGPTMTAQITPNTRQATAPQQGSIPAGLIDFAYIDGAACAAAGAMSISQWHALVKEEKAPNPVIRKPRFTRWLLSDVRDWLIQYRTQSDFTKDSEIVLEKAKRASQAAKVKSIELRQLQS
jgi:predicted DNA-binding transcriptional regulator AlpA